jgi:hypothetical protein
VKNYRKPILGLIAFLVIVAISSIRFVDSYIEWGQLEIDRLNGRSDWPGYAIYDMASIYDDFLDRLNLRDHLAPPGMDGQFSYRMREGTRLPILQIVVDRQHIQHSNVDWDGYIGSIEEMLGGLERISLTMPSARVRISFLQSMFERIEVVDMSNRKVLGSVLTSKKKPHS